MSTPISKINPKEAERVISELTPAELDHINYLSTFSPSFYRYKFLAEVQDSRYQKEYIFANDKFLSNEQRVQLLNTIDQEKKNRIEAMYIIGGVSALSVLLALYTSSPLTPIRRKIFRGVFIGIGAGGCYYAYTKSQTEGAVNRIFHSLLKQQQIRKSSKN